MALRDLFFKRQKRIRGEMPDILRYDLIPANLRVQIIMLIKDSHNLASYDSSYADSQWITSYYQGIHEDLCRELGVFNLLNKNSRDYPAIIHEYIHTTEDIEILLSVVELAFQRMNSIVPDYMDNMAYKIGRDIKDIILELNQRFVEHGIGYQFEGNEIIRVDSTFIHSEIVKPVLYLLNNKKFLGANDEYLKAHEHYKHGRNKECLVECLKAFESTIKIICKKRGWIYKETDTASTLINTLFVNGFLPTYTQNQFSGLQNLLVSGVPTVRNKTSGHGQGQVPVSVSNEITRYGLNLTGTNIIFLIEQSGI
eukprot:TRINITY_DN7171_c0_g1_i1.p1 TRINITY_DN7171_c0_g1~~TRINITY_DN7171_c0_g1_i1.p1  ORF type:complete len:311 (+),score=-59.47 TRINITY_DN7171_c0_g1_i1:707-1639(+)